MTNQPHTAANDEIRGLVEDWAAAVRTKDKAGILARHSDDIVLFDVPPPVQLRGIDAYRKSWHSFFTWLDNGGTFELSELEITAGEDVAFCHALLRCVQDVAEPGFRVTIGLRKVGGRWIVTHEHHSEPSK